jgi:hypothetical protein
MQGLRNEVEKLEDEYARRLSAVSKRDGPTTASSPQRESTAIGIRDHPHVQPIHLREAYDNLCRTKEKLRAENQALRGAIEAQERLALQLRCIMIEEQPMSSSNDEVGSTTLFGVTLAFVITHSFSSHSRESLR